MQPTRNNHYVPQWFQKGFHIKPSNQLYYLDLDPETIPLPDGSVKTLNDCKRLPTSACFCATDLYTTFFGQYINDEIEKKLFGKIDDSGSRAVRGFIEGSDSNLFKHFEAFFLFLDSQKLRTPKGLDWIRAQYPDLNQLQLMIEMQAIRSLNCSIWSEGVREIVSAQRSSTKFIVSDHPVTVYNFYCPPDSSYCRYPQDPPIKLKASQTIYPLDAEHCLILTNLEYAKSPESTSPLEARTYARNYKNSLVKPNEIIRKREFDDEQVRHINLITKSRARKFVAAGKKEWLYPEASIALDWTKLRETLLPPESELWRFGGEIYIGHSDGSTSYQDAFGRKSPAHEHLRKEVGENRLGRNDRCGCGSGKKFKDCCISVPRHLRPSWKERSIRERNLFFIDRIEDILGLNSGKGWDDVRRELNDEHVKKIHELFSFLWPVETELLDLLPKPDGRARVLFTGIVDIRTISELALSSTLYLDEIMIQNPFTNPNATSNEFNPLHHPKKYREQTLKNIALLLQLQPFISRGLVNLIPDPCALDRHLASQMMDMAENRKGTVTMSKTESALMEWLARDDFSRSLSGFPRPFWEKQIRDFNPTFTDDEVEQILASNKSRRLNDPLSLLQDDLYEESGEENSQLTILSMTPNFEMALFIAQATGSAVLTDSDYRWREINLAKMEERESNDPIKRASEDIEKSALPLTPEPHLMLDLKRNVNTVALSELLSEFITTVNKSSIGSNEALTNLDSFAQRFSEAASNTNNFFGENQEGMKTFKARYKFVAPYGGFTSQNINRLLIMSGSQYHLKQVPVGIYVSHSHEDEI